MGSKFRCVICLKDLRVSGFSPFYEVLYFWIPKGHIYLHTIKIGQDVSETHYLCLCVEDFEYVKANETVGKVLIDTRLNSGKSS